MPNQRDIARVLGVNQATVSLALRGDRSVSAKMKTRVHETAARLGYRPNAYVSSLMAHIRSGRRPSEEGVIALVVEARSESEWHRMESYRICHEGVARRALELGFRVECFFVQGPGIRPAHLDRILEARGIHGVVFAPPYRGSRELPMRWERYACVGIGHGWERQQLDRVANDHAQNVLLAFDELTRLGYRRIGMLLEGLASIGGRGLKWFPGYLEAQSRLPSERRVALFSGGTDRATPDEFRRWLNKEQPDVLLGMTGREHPLLADMGLRVPGDIGLACLVRPLDSGLTGVNEKNEIIGATALELVASQIARNEYGLPQHPKLTLIDGRWEEAGSVIQQSGAHRDEETRDCPNRKLRRGSPLISSEV